LTRTQLAIANVTVRDFIYLSFRKLYVWLRSQKKPVLAIDEAHEDDGECWISALGVTKNTDLFASGVDFLQ